MSLITKEFYDSPENRYKAAQIDWEIARCLAESGISTEGTVAPAAYLMCKAKQDCMVAELTMESVADGRLDIPEKFSALFGSSINTGCLKKSGVSCFPSQVTTQRKNWHWLR